MTTIETLSPPLFFACETGNLELLSEALRTADINSRSDSQQFTPLMIAANRSALDCVYYLIDKGADVNAQSEGGMTALMLAMNPDHQDSMFVIKRLIDAGANVNHVSGGGNTPLMEAAYYGNPDLVAMLLGAGANVNYKNQYGESPLLVGCMKRGTPESVRLLLKAGADPKAKDVDGQTPLDAARKAENVPVIQVLEEYLKIESSTK